MIRLTKKKHPLQFKAFRALDAVRSKDPLKPVFNHICKSSGVWSNDVFFVTDSRQFVSVRIKNPEKVPEMDQAELGFYEVIRSTAKEIILIPVDLGHTDFLSLKNVFPDKIKCSKPFEIWNKNKISYGETITEISSFLSKESPEYLFNICFLENIIKYFAGFNIHVFAPVQNEGFGRPMEIKVDNDCLEIRYALMPFEKVK